MENRKIVSKKRYLLALTIATVIFVFIFILAYFIAYFEYQKTIAIQDSLSYKLFQDKLSYTLFNKNVCSNNTYMEISNDLNSQIQIMTQLETRLGKDNPDVIFRKKFYTLVELEHYEFIKTINEKCNKSINTILFFYSNEKEFLDSSEKMGSILSVLYDSNKNKLVIYSIDLNLDSEIVRELKQNLNIGDIPVIIINDNTKIWKISNINDIEKYLL